MMCASVAWAESGLFKADCMVDSCCAAGRVFPFSQERFLVIACSPSHINITRSTESSMIQSSSSMILRDLGEYYNILITKTHHRAIYFDLYSLQPFGRRAACARRRVQAGLAFGIGAKRTSTVIFGPPLVHSHHDGPLTHDTRTIDPFRTSL